MNRVVILVLLCCLTVSYASTSTSTIGPWSFIWAHPNVTCDGRLDLPVNFTMINTNGTDTVSFLTLRGNGCNKLMANSHLDPHTITDGIVASLSHFDVTRSDEVLHDDNASGMSCFIFRNEEYHSIVVRYDVTPTCTNTTANDGYSPNIAAIAGWAALAFVVICAGLCVLACRFCRPR
jgi:hypothetical protein